MGYTIIKKQLLFRENNKIYLLRNMYSNNVYPHDKDYKFMIFNDEAEYLAWAGKYTELKNDVCYMNGKFISGYDYYKKLLRLIRNPANLSDYWMTIRQLIGFENKEYKLFYTPGDFRELNYKCLYNKELMEKYKDLIFNRIVKDLELKDLNNDLSHVEINIYKNKI